jgi:hypothetical protein
MRLWRWLAAVVILGACTGADRGPARIVLERLPCFGWCPSYRVVIHADGRVEYEGVGYPNDIGVDSGEVASQLHNVRRERAQISRESAALVLRRFDQAWSSWLPNRFGYGWRACPDPATDNPTLFIVRERGARRDTMELYYGCPLVPPRINGLGTYIDSVAGVNQWLGVPEF